MDTKYIPLYRKYRPQTFHDLIGQENIVHALSNAIELNRIAHAYLLCGPRGTGKTSSARILAKSLNCKEGPTLTPCGKCPACLDIMNSVPVDVIEIDAASNRSVEDTQAILEKIQYVPVNGRYKIYVIDEVHMLSNHAFNALLKTLEEPPENVIFILATTEPHKVLDTIISRCQRFDFRRITTDDIVKRLEYITQQENINISKEALFLIAKNSQGGMRDALALLDQISVLGVNKQIDINDINEILGKISYDFIYEITDCFIASDCSKSIDLINKIYSKGNEPVQIISNIIQYFRDMMIAKNCSDKELIYSLTMLNEINFDKIKTQSEKFSISEIIQIIDRLSYYATQIKDTTNKYLWLELCIIDLTNYKNLPSVENLLKRIQNLENKIESGNFEIHKEEKTISHIELPKTETQKTKRTSQEVINQDNTKTTNETEKEAILSEIKEQIKKSETQQESSPTSSDINKLWISILQSIDSPPNRAFYSNLAKPVEITENQITIAFNKEMFVKQAKEGNKKNALVDAVSKYMNIQNPNINVILSENIDLSKKINPSDLKPKINNSNNENTITKHEEEEYQNYMEAKKEEKIQVQNIDSTSQAAMVKELFDGKYIN